jgi:hypothetical protein
VYADPYDQEDRTFPIGPAIAVALVILGTIVFVVSSIEPDDPPAPPGPLVGCYSAAGGPDLMVDADSITVLRDPPLKIHSSIKFIKGWVLETNRWLDFHQSAQGNIVFEPGSANGEILAISHAGEFGSPIATFELFNEKGDLALRYTRSADECGLTRPNSAAL